jgi:endonuclease-3
MISARERTHILEIIHEIYGGKKIELDYETPFQLLIAVILSAQTTDKQVNRITPPLFTRVRECHDILDISIEEIERYTRFVNFYHNKSRFIKETGTILAEKHDGIIPNDIVTLRKMP